MNSTSAMVTYDNPLQLTNFNTEYGWNEIEANLLGASGIITGNMPTGYIKYSLEQYANAFRFQDDNSQLPDSTKPSNKPKFCADKDGKVVPCDSPERVEGGKSGVSLRGIFGLPDLPPDTDVLCSDCTKEQAEALRRTGQLPSASGSLFNIPFFGSIDVKALAFLVIGILLLVVAINKL